MSKKTLKWGVLGTGQISEIVAPAIRDSDWSVPYAVASRTLDKADGFARRHGFSRSYGSYEAVLEDPAVEVVYNPLPNWLHCEWTLRALEAGKHVLCEKPLAEDMAECRRMVAVSRQCGRLLMEAFAYRLQVDHFSRSVLGGRPLSLPFEDALGNMAVIEALRGSAQTGRETPVADA